LQRERWHARVAAASISNANSTRFHLQREQHTRRFPLQSFQESFLVGSNAASETIVFLPIACDMSHVHAPQSAAGASASASFNLAYLDEFMILR
jgi:hypothetical protein